MCYKSILFVLGCLLFSGCAFTNIPDPGSMSESSMNDDTFTFRDAGFSGQTVGQGDAAAAPETDCVNEADPVHERANDNEADAGVEDLLDASAPWGDVGLLPADGALDECETDTDAQTAVEEDPDCQEPPVRDEPNCDDDVPTVGE